MFWSDLLGTVEGADRGDGDRLLECLWLYVRKVGRNQSVAIAVIAVRVVHENLDEPKRQHAFEGLPNAPRVRAVYPYCKHLRLLLPRYLVRKSGQPP